MCRYGAPGDGHLVTFCARVRCAGGELGCQDRGGGVLVALAYLLAERDAVRSQSVSLPDRAGIDLGPEFLHTLVENLPVGAQQRVEIVKALTRDVDLLILDEPTAVLTPQ